MRTQEISYDMFLSCFEFISIRSQLNLMKIPYTLQNLVRLYFILSYRNNLFTNAYILLNANQMLIQTHLGKRQINQIVYSLEVKVKDHIIPEVKTI